MKQQSWLLLQSGPGTAPFNMALDEALLEAMPRLGKPVLRFYGWTEPAASFGYFQKYAEVERATLLRPLVRRPTGGRAKEGNFHNSATSFRGGKAPGTGSAAKTDA